MAHIAGNKLQGPETKPIRTSREVGEVEVGDLPLRILEAEWTKLEQFFDVIFDHKLPGAEDVFDLQTLCPR